MLLRFFVMIVFGLMVYRYYQEKKRYQMITFGVLAVLFQPIVKIPLERAVLECVGYSGCVGYSSFKRT